jgi:hypothetical protein
VKSAAAYWRLLWRSAIQATRTDVLALPEYRALVTEAQAKGVQVTLQEMAPTNSVNTGPNALSVGFMSAATRSRAVGLAAA